MKFEDFANLVREKRIEAGLSQRELGKRVSKSGSDARVQKIISNLETGIGCNAVTMQSVCRILGIKPTQVDGPTGNRFRARVSDWINPSVSEEDITLLCGNEALRKIVDKRATTIIREECVRFRKAISSLK